MLKSFSLIFSFLISLPLLAERLGRNTQLYEEPGKRTIAKLEANTEVNILEENDYWVKIVATAYTPIENFDNYTLELNRKTELLGDDSSKIGQVYGKLKLQGLYTINDDIIYFEVIGYVRKADIDKDWIPENRFTFLIDSSKSKITFSELKPELDKYGFDLVVNDSGFNAYQMNDIIGMDYSNPKKRLKLIFYENRLVAIFHEKPFPLKTKEVIQIGGQENLIYLRDLNADEKRIFGELFLK